MDDVKDVRIKCAGTDGRTCDKEFVWSVADQAFYKQKGFQPPKRCKDCAKRKREEVAQHQPSTT